MHIPIDWNPVDASDVDASKTTLVELCWVLYLGGPHHTSGLHLQSHDLQHDYSATYLQSPS